MQLMTPFKFFSSVKSAVEKSSNSCSPIARAAFKKRETFSIFLWTLSVVPWLYLGTESG